MVGQNQRRKPIKNNTQILNAYGQINVACLDNEKNDAKQQKECFTYEL